MLKEQIREILHSSSLENRNGSENIMIYKSGVVHKINRLLEQSHVNKRKFIDIIKEVIINDILLEENFEKYYNNVLITHNEIIIKLYESENDEKRSLGLSEIDMFYTIILDLLKDQFENLASQIASDIYTKAFSKGNPNEFIKANFKQMSYLLYKNILNHKLESIDPSLIEGLTGKILREYFNKTLYELAKLIIDNFGNGDKKAREFIDFYGKKHVIGGKTVQIGSIHRDIILGSGTEKSKIALNTSSIFQIINTRKNTQILSIEKSKKMIEGYKKKVNEIYENISTLKGKKDIKKMELESYKNENEIYKLYIENQEISEKLRFSYKDREHTKEISENFSKGLEKFNELLSSLDKNETNITNRTLDQISLIRRSIENIELKIASLEKEIQTKNELLEKETEKLEKTKEYDIEKQYQSIINQLAKLLLKPY